MLLRPHSRQVTLATAVCMPARSKNSVSVTPGIKHVTVIQYRWTHQSQQQRRVEILCVLPFTLRVQVPVPQLSARRDVRMTWTS
jgi:hypothetical protein